MIKKALILIVLLSTLALAVNYNFVVHENDLVNIIVKAIDLDEDPISYSFTYPLNSQGLWQTKFGDAGDYYIRVRASDGKLVDDKIIKLTVLEVNQAPIIVKDKIIVNETDLIDLKECFYDPNNDQLSYTFEQPFNKEGLWQTNYGDEGIYFITVSAFDGEYSVNGNIEVIVNKMNQPPVIIDHFNVQEIKEGQTLNYYVIAEDYDGDELYYVWYHNDQELSYENEGKHYFGYNSAGEHVFKVVISDGQEEIVKEFKINVENVNRAPEFEVAPITIKENEKLILNLPSKDQDGDILTYFFSAPLDNQGTWTPSYDDAGVHVLKFNVTDGEFLVEKEVEVTVIDVNRAPLINVPDIIELDEGQELSLTFETYDPDGDIINFTVKNLPEGAILINQTIHWNVSQDFVKRSGGFFSNIFNKLRLENRFLGPRKHTVTIESCDSEFCVDEKVKFIVNNVNRAPYFVGLEDVYNFTETDLVKLDFEAYDDDEDFVNIYYTKPLRSGQWQTNYGDAGQYYVWITATDGHIGTTKMVTINIERKNRIPYFKFNKVYNVYEGEETTLHFKVVDPDVDDELIVEIVDDKFNPHLDGNTLTITVPYDHVEEGSVEEGFMLKVSDGINETYSEMPLIIHHVNRPPKILDHALVNDVYVNQPVLFFVNAEDPDNDELSYKWTFDSWREGSIKGTNAIERTFTSPGEKTVKVVISDGQEKIVKEWQVNVLNKEVVKPVPKGDFSYKIYYIEH